MKGRDAHSWTKGMNTLSEGLLPAIIHWLTPRVERLNALTRRAWRTRRQRRLRLCETLALGEKRFLAVVAFEQQEFLVGGTGSTITLLTQLRSEPQRGLSPASPEPAAPGPGVLTQ